MFRPMRLLCGLFFLSCFSGFSQEAALVAPKHPGFEGERTPWVWKASAIALTGASALDMASAWGKCCEANPLLASPDRRFSTRGVAVKSGALGGQLLMQYLIARRSPRLAKVLSVINLVGAGALTAVAVRNYGVPQPPGRYGMVR